MNTNLISRYIWLLDLLTRYGALTRETINRHWMKSPLGAGRPLPERTFFHYRRAIEEIFNIKITCNPSGEYSISGGGDQRRRLTDWMLDTLAVNNALQDSAEASGRVEVEAVPSAREWLPVVLDAIRDSECITFTYAGFNRSRPETDIEFRPYFLKRYKQRWYMAGLKEKDGSIRTYALDRIKTLHTSDRRFDMPEGLSIDDLFGNIIGVTASHAEVRDVRLRTTATQAKYLRALPLHPSQREEVGDNCSVFSYRLKLNYELVHEIMSLGAEVKVEEPRELRVMVVTELRKALEQYEN